MIALGPSNGRKRRFPSSLHSTVSILKRSKKGSFGSGRVMALSESIGQLTTFQEAKVMARKEYLTWVRELKDLPEGEEIQLTIRDLSPGRRKYEARNVKAILFSSHESLPKGDLLRFRSPVGALLPDTWFIKITEDLPEYLPGTPYHEVISQERAGKSKA